MGPARINFRALPSMTTAVPTMLELSTPQSPPSLARSSALTHDLLAVTDPDGRLLDVNAAWTAMLGWSRGELLLQPILELLHPHDRIRTAEAIAIPQERPVAFTNRVRTRSGGYRCLEWTAVRDADGFLHVAASDITSIQQARATAASLERRFHQTLAQAPIGMALVDTSGECLQVNLELCRIVGCSEVELLLGRRLEDIVPPGGAEPIIELARSALHGELSAFDLVAGALRADGDEVPLHIYVSLVRDDQGEPLHFVVQVVDISEQRRHEEELAGLALHDGLTGLLNHRAFHARLLEEVERARRYGSPLCLALVQLDRFKALTDAHGHAVGDRILARTAEALQGAARTPDSLGRIGAEEFAWLLPEAPLAAAAAACEQARAEIATSTQTGEARPTLSIGLVSLAEDEADVDLFRRADEALYAARLGGRDRVVTR
jgi:diguanylate cyclase (GGDEF)-like protein/PAS domain S-box-containing protein